MELTEQDLNRIRGDFWRASLDDTNAALIAAINEAYRLGREEMRERVLRAMNRAN